MNNEKKGLVSVVVTTYKRPVDMVYRAVNSVINQTYKNIEIIVVDDSPNTYTERELVRQSIINIGDNRLTYLLNDKNIGACASRNRAIKVSNGEFVIYVDDDDELLPTCIEKRVQQFNSETIGLVYSDCYYIDEIKKKEYRSNQKKLSGYIYEELIIENFILAFPMLRRECFDKCGYFNESLPASQDWDMWLRVSKVYEVNYIDEPLSKVYLHPNERISTNSRRKIIGLETICELNSDYLETNKHANHLKIMELVPYYIADGQVKNGLNALFKAIRLEPSDCKGNIACCVLACWGIVKHAKRTIVKS